MRGEKSKMSKHIYKLPFSDIPKMPPEIIDAIDNNNLLLFVGAGVSKLIGYPLWSELAKKLAQLAVDSHDLTLSEREVLLSGEFTPMQIITVLCKRFDSKKPDSGIEKVITELSIDVKEDQKIAMKIAKYLSAYNAPIVTTNADESLEKQEPLNDRLRLYNFMDFDFEKFHNYSIIHLPGSVRNKKGMVFTSEQYAEAYNVENDFGRKLKKLFEKGWTILFIGYGVSEFELLRYFLKFKDDKVRRMFILDGYLAKDKIKYEFDKEYYESLGIYLLPYSREKNDYKQMLAVLKSWDKDVKTKTLASSIVKEEAIKNITSQMPFAESVEALVRMVNKNG